jgi:hypothetical protein
MAQDKILWWTLLNMTINHAKGAIFVFYCVTRKRKRLTQQIHNGKDTISIWMMW